MGWGSFRSNFLRRAETVTKKALRSQEALFKGDLESSAGYFVEAGEDLYAALGGTDVDRRIPPPPDAPDFGAFDLSDPFSTEGEFSKGVKRAKGSSELSKEQLLASFVDKNSITAGDFSRGSGVAF